MENGHGLAVQAKAVRAWARAYGVVLSRIFEERGVSGASELRSRPALAEALGELRRPTVEGIVVTRLDRLARDLIVQEQILAEVRRLGGKVFSTAAGEQAFLDDDPADPSRKLIRQVLGAVSEYERALIALRLAAGRARKAEAGGYACGSPPFGYRAQDGALVPNAAEQVTLRRARELHAAGRSLREIASTLASEGHRPKRSTQWHPQSIARILGQAR